MSKDLNAPDLTEHQWSEHWEHKKSRQHLDALAEAGWCPECDEGELDAEWAERNL